MSSKRFERHATQGGVNNFALSFNNLKKKEMKFREVPDLSRTQQMGGALTVAGLLAAGTGAWIRSIRQALTSNADEQKQAKLELLLKYPVIFRVFFKQEVESIAVQRTSHVTTRVLAFKVLAKGDAGTLASAWLRAEFTPQEQPLANAWFRTEFTPQEQRRILQELGATGVEEVRAVDDGPLEVGPPSRLIDMGNAVQTSSDEDGPAVAVVPHARASVDVSRNVLMATQDAEYAASS